MDNRFRDFWRFNAKDEVAMKHPEESNGIKETLNKSPRTSWRHLFRLTLPEKLEIHKVFLRFSGFVRRKICSPIRTR